MLVKNAASAKQSFFVLFPHLYPQSFPVAQEAGWLFLLEERMFCSLTV